MFKKLKELIQLTKTLEEKNNRLKELENKLQDKESTWKDLVDSAVSQSQKDIVALEEEKEKELNDLNTKITKQHALSTEYESTIEQLKSNYEKVSKQLETQRKKLSSCKSLYRAMTTSIDRFFKDEANYHHLKLPESMMNEVDEIAPTVTLAFHAMDIKDLRKSFNDYSKLIAQTLEKYESRYTTKTNAAIYKLMVIALKSEFQNILYNLKYDKLEKSIDDIKTITHKYFAIASSGNQSIAPTLTKFISEIEYLFIESLKIEYEYYIQKERQKEEQAMLREQMRQETEDRKVLEQQKKQVEKEEEKYKNEIQKVKELLSSTSDNDKFLQLQAKIAELQAQLESVEHKKDEIVSRQNGKAGYVYIISNLGSFGDDVFKIGMTRRLDPQDRVNELGDASVPFTFDVHSFIFSDDAVLLEQQLHSALDDKRVNKVNLRKEFFNVSIDELETLVTDINPAAEFKHTMIAMQYRQTLSINEENSYQDIRA